MKSLSATAEQMEAIDYFSTGESLKINAFAGSGKTATLKILADSSKQSGLYLAFNKTLAEEAKSNFPYWVTCRTCHSLAFRSTPQALRNNREKMFGVINSNRITQLLSLKPIKLKQDFELTSSHCGSLVKETLRKFMQSDDADINNQHVPVLGKLKSATVSQLDVIKKNIVKNSKKLWERMINPEDHDVPLGHDGYFKLWALSQPTIPVDYILLDEAQDTAPVMLGVLRNQDCQVVLAGDKYQQIYEWRGAVNAMEKFHTKHETTLTQSFRFGDAIADAASKLLSLLGETMRVHGNPEIESKLGCSAPDAILCRTNEGVINHVIRCLNTGVIPHILGGNGEIVRFLTAVRKLKAGKVSDEPEFFGFTNWSEVIAVSKTDEGAGLRTIVRIVERYGEEKLLTELTKMNSSEKDAKLIISTVHKAKGRQWNNVVIVDDFEISDTNDRLNRSEVQLIYVGLTRARKEAQLPNSITSRFHIKQDFQVMDLDAA